MNIDEYLLNEMLAIQIQQSRKRVTHNDQIAFSSYTRLIYHLIPNMVILLIKSSQNITPSFSHIIQNI